MNRRGFLGGLLALGAAPAIIRTPGLLMPIRAYHPWELDPMWGVTCISGGVIRADSIRNYTISLDKVVAESLGVPPHLLVQGRELRVA